MQNIYLNHIRPPIIRDSAICYIPRDSKQRNDNDKYLDYST